MAKILITNSPDNHALSGEYNKGAAAVAISSIKMLKEYVPNAEFASFIQFTQGFANSHGVRVIQTLK